MRGRKGPSPGRGLGRASAPPTDRILGRKAQKGPLGTHAWMRLSEVVEAIRAGGTIDYLDEYDVEIWGADPVIYLQERVTILEGRVRRAEAQGLPKAAANFETTRLELISVLAEVLPH